LEAARRIASLFDYNKVYHVKLTKYKDANEYLVAGEGDALRQAWWAAKKYLPEEIVSSLSEFESILTELPKYGVPYPFPTLTSMTYGIRPGETILFTAQEGVGKTEMMHAIEYNILKETEANVGAIFLEEPKRRHLQALAGIKLSRPAHLPDSGCSPVQITTALKEVVAKDERLYLYSHFGSNDPEVLLDTIRFMASSCGCRFILFDHISMAVSGLAGDDERKALDYLSTRLEMMVKELDFALLLVSHVNDHGDTRGSRYISKVCDIRVDLSRDVKGGSNVIDLVVSKNRFCGKTGPAGKIVFDPITYTLSEDMLDVQAANDNQEQSPKETVWETNLRPAA
jgi:twinkle protein